MRMNLPKAASPKVIFKLEDGGLLKKLSSSQTSPTKHQWLPLTFNEHKSENIIITSCEMWQGYTGVNFRFASSTEAVQRQMFPLNVNYFERVLHQEAPGVLTGPTGEWDCIGYVTCGGLTEGFVTDLRYFTLEGL